MKDFTREFTSPTHNHVVTIKLLMFSYISMVSVYEFKLSTLLKQSDLEFYDFVQTFIFKLN